MSVGGGRSGSSSIRIALGRVLVRPRLVVKELTRLVTLAPISFAEAAHVVFDRDDKIKGFLKILQLWFGDGWFVVKMSRKSGRKV